MMALIRLLNGKEQSVSPEVAKEIWSVLSGQKEGTEGQQQFCSNVGNIYLNWRNAPDEYVLANAGVIGELVKLYFMCDKNGKLTRPEPTDRDSWRVARLLKLV